MPIRPGDARALTETLVRVDSRNPTLVPGAPGESACAHVLAEVLGGWGFRLEWQDVRDGRANLIARIGTPEPGAPVLMFNGHLDVVGVDGMTHAPFAPVIRDGLLYGRGSCDMKAGVAAMCVAAWQAAQRPMRGEIIVAAVIDEEFESLGTRDMLERGVRADVAVVTEPTRLAICPAHRGFVWLEFTFAGRAAHGSRYDLGVDAIQHAAMVLTALDRMQHSLLVTRTHPLLGRASLHASTIQGGVGWSTYPDQCTLRVERRTVPGETTASVLHEVELLLAELHRAEPQLMVSVRVDTAQGPSNVSPDAPLVQRLAQAHLAVGGHLPPVEGLSAWTDAALLNDAGIPAVCFGPGDIALAHAATEYVPLAEIDAATAVLTAFALDWCS
ncbi:MAG TPA: ArgE/DapE family deacylase [Gemmatimonadaceae bacterium]|nr:ArgE/DapE family deacylase [Gemmatimonadaceae bacterium]